MCLIDKQGVVTATLISIHLSAHY